MRGRFGVVLSALVAVPVYAGPMEDSIERQLRAQGFNEVSVTRTWLGRSRIVAQSKTLKREIIVNPSNGEILRDYTIRRSGEDTEESLIFNPVPNRGRDAGDSDDEDSTSRDNDDNGDDGGNDSGGDRGDDGGDDRGNGGSDGGEGDSENEGDED